MRTCDNGKSRMETFKFQTMRNMQRISIGTTKPFVGASHEVAIIGPESTILSLLIIIYLCRDIILHIWILENISIHYDNLFTVD